MIKNYFIVAFRNLWRNKTFSFINIAGLSVALAACMLILLYAKDEKSYDRFHKNAPQIYHLTADMKAPDGKINKNSNSGYMPGPAFKAGVPEVEEAVRIQSQTFPAKLKTDVIDQDVLAVDDNFFSVFSFPLLHGDPKTALGDIHSVVLSADAAKKYFGTTDALGKVLQLKIDTAFVPFQVSAVAKNAPQNSSIKFELLLPMKFILSINHDDQWVNFFLNTFILTRPGTDPAKLVPKFQKIYETQAAGQLKEIADKYGFKDRILWGLQPFTGMHQSTDYPAQNGLSDASNPMYSYILSGIAILILIIACINFVNLTVARSLKRAKEIGIRKVVGGQRNQLILQFLGESFILSFLAFVLAVGLVQLVLPVFNELSNKALAFSYLFDWKLVMGYIGLFVVTGLLAGFYPALVLSGFNPVNTLYGRTKLSNKNYLSRALVVLQFSMATFLIISTAVIYSQFNYLVHADLGYNNKNVVTVRAGGMNRARYAVFQNELLKNPAIRQVTADQGGRWMTNARINDGKDANFEFKVIDDQYLPLFGMKLAKGRNFDQNNLQDSASGALVNESFVTSAGWKEPLGQVIDFFYMNKKYYVIGVIKDYHYTSLNEKIGPEVLIADPRYQYGDVHIKIDPRQRSAALNHIAASFKNLFPWQPYQYHFQEDANAQQYELENKWKQMISFGAILTIFISCIGLFGLATLSAEKRTKEIGIRKVLGASIAGIAQKLSVDFVRLVMISLVIAIPLAWWATHHWLENYPYRVKLEWWVFGGACLLVLMIALLTISFQVIRAATANPVKSLKEM